MAEGVFLAAPAHVANIEVGGSKGVPSILRNIVRLRYPRSGAALRLKAGLWHQRRRHSSWGFPRGSVHVAKNRSPAVPPAGVLHCVSRQGSGTSRIRVRPRGKGRWAAAWPPASRPGRRPTPRRPANGRAARRTQVGARATYVQRTCNIRATYVQRTCNVPFFTHYTRGSVRKTYFLLV